MTRLSTTNHRKVINIQKWSGFFGPPCSNQDAALQRPNRVTEAQDHKGCLAPKINTLNTDYINYTS